MSCLVKALINYLGTQSTVTDEIPASRMFHTLVPQGTRITGDNPALTVRLIGYDPQNGQAGSVTPVQVSIEIVVMSDRPAAVKQAWEAIRKVTDGLAATIGPVGATVEIISMQLEDVIEGLVPPANAGELGVPDARMVYDVWERVTAPSV